MGFSKSRRQTAYSCPEGSQECNRKLTSKAETDIVEQSVQGDGEDNTTQGSSRHHNTKSETLAGVEVMTHDGQRSAEQKAQANTTEDRLRKEELVVLFAEAGQDEGHHVYQGGRDGQL